MRLGRFGRNSPSTIVEVGVEDSIDDVESTTFSNMLQYMAEYLVE